MGFQWTPDLAVGVKEIDDQHKALFKAVDDLIEAMERSEGAKELERIVSYLGDCMKKHFSLEEDYMARFRYPDAIRHRSQHQAFLKAYSSLVELLNTEGTSLAQMLDARKAVCDWFRGHVSNTDKKLGAFLQERLEAA